MSEYAIYKLQGKVAVITGGTKGIGFAIAKAYAKAGANVVVASRTAKDCETAAKELEKLGVQALGIPTDVSKISEIEKLNKIVLDKFGTIDILVNNAGSAITKRAVDLTEQDWDFILDLDLKSVFFCSQILGKVMRDKKQGRIINIASAAAFMGEKQLLPYCCAKAGVLQISKVLALEWSKEFNITINSICPGYFITEMNREELQKEKVRSVVTSRIPMGRVGELHELEGCALYLASEQSSYMTGQYIIVDGGRLAR